MTTQLIIATSDDQRSPAPISLTMTAGVVLVRMPGPSSHTAPETPPTPPASQRDPATAGFPDEEAVTWEDAEWQ